MFPECACACACVFHSFHVKCLENIFIHTHNMNTSSTGLFSSARASAKVRFRCLSCSAKAKKLFLLQLVKL